MSMKTASSSIRPEPWNKGRLIGQKRPLKPKEVWAIRVRLEIAGTKRNLALFNLAIDSKLRACDLVVLRIEDVCLGCACATGRPSFSARLADPSNLRSQKRRAQQFRVGSPPAA